MTVVNRAGFAVLAGIGLMVSAASAQDDPIVIGSSLPLTGNFSVSGEKHQQGFELCVELINEKGGLLGRPVELVVSDNRSDTETAISQYERLINVDQVDVVFGTFSSQAHLPDLVGDGEIRDDPSGPGRRGAAHLVAGLEAHLLLPAERRGAGRRRR